MHKKGISSIISAIERFFNRLGEGEIKFGLAIA
ncbi:hypothetical protein ZORO111903_03185 [Zobellia roscoffensis]